MEIVHLTALADDEGHLMLDVPESMRGREIRITLATHEPVSWDTAPRDELGWPIGFLEHYLGSMPDFPADPEDEPAEDVESI